MTDTSPRSDRERKQWPIIGTDFIEHAWEHVQHMIEEGCSTRAILTLLATAGELLAGDGAVTSILVLDGDGLLRNGASPNLPTDYLAAIDRLKPNPNLGTCAAAAATGREVLTPSFNADNKWAELRHLPAALGFAGAWSLPIKREDGTVIGTFGTYFRTSRCPTAEERAGVKKLAAAAALALGDRNVPVGKDFFEVTGFRQSNKR